VDRLDDVIINYITYLGYQCTLMAATPGTADVDFREIENHENFAFRIRNRARLFFMAAESLVSP
jgi:hypothetical protein